MHESNLTIIKKLNCLKVHCAVDLENEKRQEKQIFHQIIPKKKTTTSKGFESILKSSCFQFLPIKLNIETLQLIIYKLDKCQKIFHQMGSSISDVFLYGIVMNFIRRDH